MHRGSVIEILSGVKKCRRGGKAVGHCKVAFARPLAICIFRLIIDIVVVVIHGPRRARRTGFNRTQGGKGPSQSMKCQRTSWVGQIRMLLSSTGQASDVTSCEHALDGLALAKPHWPAQRIGKLLTFSESLQARTHPCLIRELALDERAECGGEEVTEEQLGHAPEAVPYLTV